MAAASVPVWAVRPVPSRPSVFRSGPFTRQVQSSVGRLPIDSHLSDSGTISARCCSSFFYLLIIVFHSATLLFIMFYYYVFFFVPGTASASLAVTVVAEQPATDSSGREEGQSAVPTSDEFIFQLINSELYSLLGTI